MRYQLFYILLSVFTIFVSCKSKGSTYPPQNSSCVYLQNGKLYTSNDEELSLWGVNLQSCLSWEYGARRLKELGIPETAEALKQMADNNLDEVQQLKVSTIRCHLTPVDFTDEDGNLVETPYLDVLDYMVAGAAKRGIYMSFAFVTSISNGYMKNSMWNKRRHEESIHDEDMVKKSKNYVKQLLNRKNKYTGRTYAEESWIAMWEMINEPAVYGYEELKQKQVYYDNFLEWAKVNGQTDNETSYISFRQNLVKNYIDGMYEQIRSTNAKQPILWSHNWHRYRNDFEDVFTAALDTKVEVVACCNYPGQDIAGPAYWNNPRDLTSQDYSTWFNEYFDAENGYGWMRLPSYANKAKCVYEFETFFNQSAYLYPIQAQYFKALGVQSANMWAYVQKEYATYHAGSHFLSLTCTPSKAASFMVAHEIFKATPLNQPYDRNLNEQVATNYVISKSHDVAIFSTKDKLYYSNSIDEWCPIDISDKVKSIVGIGNSELVTYSGSGIYMIDEVDGELHINLQPNHTWLQPAWNSLNKGLISSLDYDTLNTLTIKLANWGEGSYSLSRIEDNGQELVRSLNSLENIELKAGKYMITKE